MKRALVIVDLQNDFMPTGTLPVPEGDQIIPLANQLQEYFGLVVATQDWHPSTHGSFADNYPDATLGDEITLAGLSQILWPAHCVQNTKGAEFVPSLNSKKITHVFHKGVDPNIDSYSGFFDNAHRRSTGLGEFLREQNVTEVYLLGLATDYCIKYSALDARKLGFKTFVIADACRGINLKPNDVADAIEEMKRAGVKIIQSDNILEQKSLNE